MWYIWLILAGIFMIAEIMTVGFLIFWLGLGSLCAMITSFFTDNIIIQTAVFVVTSTFCTRPFVKKLTKKDKTVVTNAFAIVGKKAIVLKDINPTDGTGQIKVDGQVWSAKCEEGKIIPKDSEVLVLAIDGVKAVVADKSSNKLEAKGNVN